MIYELLGTLKHDQSPWIQIPANTRSIILKLTPEQKENVLKFWASK